VVAAFLNHLYSHTPSSDNDVLWWRLKKNVCFDIRSYYYAIRDSPMRAFPWKCVWRSKAPRRVCFFVWSVAWGRILTCDNLIKRGYTMTSWYCMCQCDGETVDHLLLHCKIAGVLWNYVFQSFGLQWVFPNRLVDLLFGWWNLLGKHTSEIWNLIPPCLLWTVWRERNCRIFEDTEKSPSQLLDCFASLLFEWSRAWGFTTSTTIVQFISSLSLT
jgi:hypothetical protein